MTSSLDDLLVDGVQQSQGVLRNSDDLPIHEPALDEVVNSDKNLFSFHRRAEAIKEADIIVAALRLPSPG